MIIFILGLSIGLIIENSRLSKVIDDNRDNEIDALDLKLQNYYYQIMDDTTCDLAFKQNLIFSDKLYNEGLEIEKFEEFNQITDRLKAEKKRYVLLKLELWLNMITLREKCGDDFDIIVYFYSNDPSNSEIVAQQKIISNILKDIKEEFGNNVILIPIAGDLDLGIVDLQKKVYNVNSLPSILINEQYLIEGFESKDKIISYFN
jgi:hypothetical protein